MPSLGPSGTSLWKRAFVKKRDDASADEQLYFRLRLEELREKAKVLVARIARDMPEYTVHDITHLDALWETASLVTPTELQLNPPEAFVFGAAVLLHDAGMTLAAYPGGIADLKRSPVWEDVAALRGVMIPSSKAESLSAPLLEAEQLIKTEVLRRLHAEKAEQLATQGWRLRENSEEYEHLINDPELRRFYGSKIGLIAHSHWWPLNKVDRELDLVLGAMSPRTKLEVDLLKLACLLRVADVLHLDRRRAPHFVRALEKPQGVSALHWAFQEKLAFPRLVDDAVIFTAGEPFAKNEAEAWWLAYDVFKLADKELRATDLLLRDKRQRGLAARRVKGAGDPGELACYVPVLGWRPVETSIRVSDIPKIVETLGGERLYGSNATAPLRELLQNSFDAIQARRRLERRSDDWGQVVVSLEERDDGIWLAVEDNGVGMSEFVLTQVLLDFGTSFWRSSQSIDEFPTLAAKGMTPIGRFGIGFFSVFMLGDHVRVVTRRCDQAVINSLALEFRNGLFSRPILSVAVRDSPVDGGTRVEVRLYVDPRRKNNGIQLLPKSGRTIFDILSATPSEFRSLADLASHVAPASDILIEVIEFGNRTTAARPGDWVSIPPTELLNRVTAHRLTKGEMKDVQARMEIIKNNEGTVFGRAALLPAELYHHGALVDNGLRIASLSNIVGLCTEKSRRWHVM